MANFQILDSLPILIMFLRAVPQPIPHDQATKQYHPYYRRRLRHRQVNGYDELRERRKATHHLGH